MATVRWDLGDFQNPRELLRLRPWWWDLGGFLDDFGCGRLATAASWDLGDFAVDLLVLR